MMHYQPTAARRASVLDLRIDCFCSLDAFVAALGGGPEGNVPTLITFVNPGAARKVRHDPTYSNALARFNYVLPDGIGVCVAARWLGYPDTARLSFDTTSLAPALFSVAAARGLSVALIGGAPGVSELAAGVLQAAFPGLRIVATLDGYSAPADQIRELLAASPDVVICGMGVGRQEHFLLGLAASGWSGWGFTCGGYLDQLAGGMEYYPCWVNAMDLRWAYRIFREPRRLWRRYLVDYGEFACRLAWAVVGHPNRILGWPGVGRNRLTGSEPGSSPTPDTGVNNAFGVESSLS